MRQRGFSFLPEGRESHGVLPWVIAVMVYLMVLAVAGGIGIVNATRDWSSGLKRSWTVQILTADGEPRQSEMQAAIRFLANRQGISDVTALSDTQARALLEPWLGAESQNADLPVPGLIDVALQPGASLDARAVEAELKAYAPSARIDDHEQWLVQLKDFARGLQSLAYLIVGLVTLATIAIVAFSTRAGLSSHRATIEILHLMGAEDSQIAREFQWRYMIHGFKGSLAGAVVGLVTVIGIGALAQRLGGGLVGSATFEPWNWAVLALLPLVAAIITMVTARWTVHRALAEFL